jgi:SAM-dependent MidA family methyltransferase
VDFQALAQAAEGMGARVHGRCRKACCCAGSASSSGRPRSRRARRRLCRHDQAALRRLTDEDRTGMGRLFKALAVSDPKLDALPGFIE